MGTPNYVLTRAIDELPEGAFVRPIKLCYLPKDWKDYVKGAAFFSPETEVVCYTAKRFRIIPLDAMRRTA